MVKMLLSLLAGVVIFMIAAVSLGFLQIPGLETHEKAVTAPPPTEEQLGGDLYPAEPFPVVAAEAFKPKGNPITLRAHVNIKDKQEVPALVAGQILYIGAAIPDGVVQAAGAAPFLAEPYYYNTVMVGHDNVYKFYRRLLPDDEVQSDEIIGMIDCSKALAALEEKQIKIRAAINDDKSAKAASDEAASRYERDSLLRLKGGIAEAELSASRAAKEKFYYDWKAKSDGVDNSRNELRQAYLYYGQHEIRNKVPYKRCLIQFIHKHRGDPVKEQDVVMTVHSLDHLQAEALVDESYLDRFTQKMTATIEPTQEVPPKGQFPGAHRGEVTAIAVTNDETAPRVVSAGSDRVVNVRDPVNGGPPIRLPHDDIVRALVCSPVKAEHNLCLAGAGSKITIWNLDRKALDAAVHDATRERKPLKPAEMIADAHPATDGSDASRITSLAFSPDGKYFASGAEDGSIAIWRCAVNSDGTVECPLVYRFDLAHGVEHGHTDPITALTFTPQSRLVSASSDKTVRVWMLKQKGALLEGEPITGRDGNVARLGVRADGKWFLFDKGNTLQFLSLETPGAPITTLQNPGAGATPFETLAQFSPDGKLLLTAGQADGRLQLWMAPTETSRGFEVREYLPTDKQFPVTCAAFFPRTYKNHGYAVSGTAGGEVYFWVLPTEDEIKDFRIEHVPVRLLSQMVDFNTHQARVAVDVENTNGRLRPGRMVTVVIGEQ